MKYIISLVLALLAFQADAATYYYSKCDTGSHASCVAGNDSNAGTDPAAPKLTAPTTFAAGNSYLLARGGAWTGLASLSMYVPASTKENPIVIGDYTPTGCIGGCATQKPIMVFTGSAFRFTDGSAADRDEGYTLRNLDLRGGGYEASCNTVATTSYPSSTYGVYGYNDVDYVTVSGLSINGFDIGIYVATGNGTPNPGANNLQEGWVIRDSVICNNKTQGLLGAGPRMLLENSVFDNNGHGGTGAASSALYHNIYLSSGEPTSGVIVRGNTLTRNSVRGAGPSCTSVSLVAHGSLPDLTVEHNTVIDTTSTSGCFSIGLNGVTGGETPQDFARLVIRGNVTVINGDGSEGINCSSCPDALIENNTVVRLGSSGSFMGIGVGNYPSTPVGSLAEGRATVRNNSIYIETPGTSSRGIDLGDTTENDYGESVVGNLIYFAAGTSASPVCFKYGTGRAAGTFSAFDRNLCYRATTPTWSSEHSTLAAAQAVGLNTNGSTADPTLAATPASGNSYSMAVNSGSTAIDACTTGCSRTARGRYLANGTRDIGSHEFGATVQAPVGPAAGRVQ